MSKWITSTVNECVNIKHGFAFKGEFFVSNPTSDILITPGNFKIGGGFKLGKLKYYAGPVPTDYILKPDDVVVTMTDLSKEGDTLGYSAKIPSSSQYRFLHNQRVGLLEPVSEKVSLGFLYWVLRSRNYQQFIVGSAPGTTVKHTSPSRIGEFSFSHPEAIEEQIQIAEILSSLDDKIELNNKINAELEALAQTLFKRWFVDFEFPNENGEPYKSSGGEMVESKLGMIPKGWEVGSFGQICKVAGGYAFKSKDFKAVGAHGILKIRNVYGKIVDVTNTQFVSSDVVDRISAKFRVEPGNILIAMTGAEVGKIGVVPDSLKSVWLNQRVGKFVPTIENSDIFVYQLFNAKNLTDVVRSAAMGSAQPNISSTGIESLKIVIPTREMILKYSQSNSEGFELLYKSLGENQIISSVRDTLLPRLISGELSVANQNIDSLSIL